jgi:hypothetical protein
MDLNPYVFSIDMLRSNLCFKLCFLFKKRHTISDSWIARLQINLFARYNNEQMLNSSHRDFNYFLQPYAKRAFRIPKTTAVKVNIILIFNTNQSFHVRLQFRFFEPTNLSNWKPQNL